jgi:hypothetical protein
MSTRKRQNDSASWQRTCNGKSSRFNRQSLTIQRYPRPSASTHVNGRKGVTPGPDGTWRRRLCLELSFAYCEGHEASFAPMDLLEMQPAKADNAGRARESTEALLARIRQEKLSGEFGIRLIARDVACERPPIGAISRTLFRLHDGKNNAPDTASGASANHYSISQSCRS